MTIPNHTRTFSSFRSVKKIPYLLLPIALFSMVALFGFRPSPLSIPDHTLSSPLVLPPGWTAPPVPADNPITMEKFTLGRYLFYETELSGDGNTSCGTCHDIAKAFSAGGPHTGAFGVQSLPIRDVPRLMNVGYDTVLTWDGHIQTLEDQVTIAVQKKGDLFASKENPLQADTTVVFARLANNPAYTQMFTAAFGDGQITLDRISKAIATFERCFISGNSEFDQYLNGDSSAMSASAIRGMKLFFDTASANCSECHNDLGTRGNAPGNIFSDNNYYRTGTFEFAPNRPGGGGYGFDTTSDTIINPGADSLLDPGRAAVTGDTSDIGKFRTPSLRNVNLTGPYGADGTVANLSDVIANYNAGGMADFQVSPISNKDPRIKPLKLTSTQMSDLQAFLQSLTDYSFISDTFLTAPPPAVAQVDNYVLSENLSFYPNPASGIVNIVCPDFPDQTNVSLISESGVRVMQRALNANGKFQLDFSSIANGSYRLELRNEDKARAINIVIEH